VYTGKFSLHVHAHGTFDKSFWKLHVQCPMYIAALPSAPRVERDSNLYLAVLTRDDRLHAALFKTFYVYG
jgi:hypothetical protein